MKEIKLWLSANELSKLTCMPDTAREVNALASEKFWNRKLDGNIYVYSLVRLPEEAINEYLASVTGVIPSNPSQHSNQVKYWYTPKELAELCPDSDNPQTFIARAKKGNWVNRKSFKQDPKGIIEYHVASMPDFMLADLGFTTNQHKVNWYTAKQLIGLPSIPQTPQSIIRFAKKNGWKTRTAPHGKGKKPYQFHIDSLPEETQTALSKGVSDQT